MTDERRKGKRHPAKMPVKLRPTEGVTPYSQSAETINISESGLLMLPIGRLYDHPIIMPETTAVRLSINPCDRGLVSTAVKILNGGQGRLTYTFDQPGQNITALNRIAAAAAIRSFYAYLSRRGVVPANPASQLSAPKVPTLLPTFLKRRETEARTGSPATSAVNGSNAHSRSSLKSRTTTPISTVTMFKIVPNPLNIFLGPHQRWINYKKALANSDATSKLTRAF